MCCSALRAFAAAAAMMIVTGTAYSATVKEVFEQYKQLGTFGWDCSKPPSNDNRYFINRVIDDNHVQRETMVGATERTNTAVVDKAEPLGPNHISVSGKRDRQDAEAVWYVEPDRQFALEVSIGGKKVVTGGKLVANGQQIRWTYKCGETPR